MIKENNENMFNRLNVHYYELAKEFRQVILTYDI